MVHTCQYVCTQTWLAGSNDVENAQIWGVVDEMSGLLKKVHKLLFEKGEANKVVCVTARKVRNGCWLAVVVTGFEFIQTYFTPIPWSNKMPCS